MVKEKRREGRGQDEEDEIVLFVIVFKIIRISTFYFESARFWLLS